MMGGVTGASNTMGGIMGVFPLPNCIFRGRSVSVELCQSYFLTILLKNFTAAGVLRKNIWFSIPVPKIKFDPPPQGKNALVLIF